MRLLLPAVVLVPLAILLMGAWITWDSALDEARAEVAQSAGAAAEHARTLFEQHRLRTELVDQVLGARTGAEIRAEEASLHSRLRQALGL